VFRDRINAFLNQNTESPRLYDAKQGAMAELLQKLSVVEDIGTTQETPREHYAEVVTHLRADTIHEAPVRKISGVVASYMRDLIQEQDASLLLERLLRFATERQSTRLYKTLLMGCLSCLDIDSPAVTNLTHFAQANIQKYPQRWRDRLEQFKLLEPPYGGLIGDLLTRSIDEPSYNQLITDSGLQSFRATGIGRCAYLRVCESIHQISVANESPAQIEQAVRNWKYHAITKTPDSASPSLRITAADVRYGVESMLLPWVNKQPTPLVKNTIQNLLLDTLSDPRTKPANWSGISVPCLQLIKQWLALESFEVFIRVISKVAMVNHWEDRKKFWGWYFDENHVTEVWPVVGPKAAYELDKMNREATDGSKLKFGRLSGAYSSDQCVLLMKIGDLTIAEWSHNGSVRFWFSGNDSVPNLYQNNYHADRLRRNSDWDRAHTQNRWQGDVDRELAQHTGIRQFNTQSFR
jgi:hypothetical protein